MAEGVFEIKANYDDGFVTEGSDAPAFSVSDEHGISGIENLTLRVADERLALVRSAILKVADLEADLDCSGLTVEFPFNAIEADEGEDFYPRYGRVAAYVDGAVWTTQDKHSDVTVETRSILLGEIEDHLVARGLLADADRAAMPAEASASAAP